MLVLTSLSFAQDNLDLSLMLGNKNSDKIEYNGDVVGLLNLIVFQINGGVQTEGNGKINLIISKNIDHSNLRRTVKFKAPKNILTYRHALIYCSNVMGSVLDYHNNTLYLYNADRDYRDLYITRRLPRSNLLDQLLEISSEVSDIDYQYELRERYESAKFSWFKLNAGSYDVDKRMILFRGTNKDFSLLEAKLILSLENNSE
ncbi:hypothetical protein [Persicirhabdus sediminis]|uniref:Uncharacterized protein n=1 Tax=Persicirhabdus sediminis TaxID=454144 RepID=A0A8J7MGV5_9BACT|nr:hypothetical protein [Persicirhabdus sediminis]MBK1791518.1 hypothetical protein [Persicirhabdus sediminis]